MKSPDEVLFLEKYIERFHRFCFNTYGNAVEVVNASVIYMMDPFLCLKRGNKGPTADLKEDRREEAQLHAIEAEEGEEEEAPLVRKERKAATPRKRSKPTLTLSLRLKGQRYTSTAHALFLLVSALSACAKIVFGFFRGQRIEHSYPRG